MAFKERTDASSKPHILSILKDEKILTIQVSAHRKGALTSPLDFMDADLHLKGK